MIRPGHSCCLNRRECYHILCRRWMPDDGDGVFGVRSFELRVCFILEGAQATQRHVSQDLECGRCRADSRSGEFGSIADRSRLAIRPKFDAGQRHHEASLADRRTGLATPFSIRLPVEPGNLPATAFIATPRYHGGSWHCIGRFDGHCVMRSPICIAFCTPRCMMCGAITARPAATFGE
jgi:hypothetical protein